MKKLSFVFSVISVILHVFGFAYQILSSHFKGQIILNIEIKSDLKENIDWVLSNLGCPKGG